MSNDTDTKKQEIEDVLSQAQTIDPNDPDMLQKLNEMALKIAESQGKKVNTNPNAEVDPMDELGCEGCQ